MRDNRTAAAVQRNGRRRAGMLMGALLLIALGAVGVIRTSSSAGASSLGPLEAAWNRAQSAGSYHFRSDVEQVTTPEAAVANAGRTSRVDQFFLEGDADVANSAMEFRLWADGGNVADGAESVAVRVADGITYQQINGEGWQESAGVADGVAPAGDFMSYLAAARDVTDMGAETRGSNTFTRYTFRIDGPAFADAAIAQARAAMEQRGELPVGAELQTPAYYRDMTGTGELWVDTNGFPLRQTVTLDFPARDGEYATANITVDFSAFGTANLTEGEGSSEVLDSFGTWWNDHSGDIGQAALLALAIALLAAGIGRSALRPETKLSLSLVLATSFVVGSLAGTATAQSPATAQPPTRAAPHDVAEQSRSFARYQADNLADPHENRLALLGGSLPQQAAVAPFVANDGTDTDVDGLTDFVEVSIGTDPELADTDGDGIDDNDEVRGFTVVGQTERWYGDPNAIDSNADGILDTVEWDANGDGQPDDTDGDDVPDLFDDDNDGDGVPDRLDLAPFSTASGYTEANPLALRINNLTAAADVPVYVDFQVRPQDAERIKFVDNPLDWPTNDFQGQIRDVNDSADDLQLVPMLEIRLPADHELPSEEELETFAITVTTFDEATGEQAAYVPLSMVTDAETGERIGFSGRMSYRSASDWSSAHSLRMVWAVHVDNDIPCDPDAEGCPASGYLYDRPMVVHRYYDDWLLAGLTVTEQHGADVAVIYEDPTRDADIRNDGPIWTLSDVLAQRFLAPVPSAADPDVLEYEVTVDNIDDQYDWTMNGGADDGLYALPNTFRVETASYATFEEAVYATASDVTPQVLADHFDAVWNPADAVMPRLMTAYRSETRVVTLDQASEFSGHVQIDRESSVIAIDLAPGFGERTPFVTTGGLKWAAYCDGPDSWRTCGTNEVWTDLDDRYGDQQLDVDDLTPTTGLEPGTANGQNMIMFIYESAIAQGLVGPLETRATINGDAEINQGPGDSSELVERVVRTASNKGAKVLANQVLKEVSPQAKAFAAKYSELTVEPQYATAVKSLGAGSLAKRSLIVAGFIAAATILAYTVYAAQGGNQDAQVTIAALAVAFTATTGVLLPSLTLFNALTSTTGSTASIFSVSAALQGTMGWAAVFGSVVAVGVVWGFFLADVLADDGPQAGSPQFNAALAAVIATTIQIVLFLVLSVVALVGLIFVGIFGVVDAVLALLCALGDPTPEVGCSLSAALATAISSVLYGYSPKIDLSRDDLVVTGTPQYELNDAAQGYTVGNQLRVQLPVTTNIHHLEPSHWAADDSLLAYSAHNLTQTTFTYAVTTSPDPDVSASVGDDQLAWRNVTADRTVGDGYDAYELFGGNKRDQLSLDQPIALDAAGINQTYTIFFTTAYAIPAYECWLFVCDHDEVISDRSTVEFDAIDLDILPGDLDGFTAVLDVDGGRRLAWDRAFRLLDDADGDGLRNAAAGGVDPDDTQWDSDGDGLSDRFELEQRELGLALSPLDWDSDDDGLSDAQELDLETNPGVADTDNDGVSDGDEVRHMAFALDERTNSVVWTGTFAGGWQVELGNGESPTNPGSVWVSSDPLNADADRDGINDRAERQLSQTPGSRVDDNGMAYHPSVANVAPVSITIDVDDADRYVVPGQELTVTSNVVATTRIEPSVLDLTLPYGEPVPPALLPFDPDTFADTQSVSNDTTFSVPADQSSDTVSISADVRASLPVPRGAEPDAVDMTISSTTGLPLGSDKPFGGVDVAARTADLPDQYQQAEITAASGSAGSAQDVYDRDLTTGTRAQLDRDAQEGQRVSADAVSTPRNGKFPWCETQPSSPPCPVDVDSLSGDQDPSIACNDDGVCLTTWEQQDNCNVMYIDALRVNNGSDASGGADIAMYLRRGPIFERIWYNPNLDTGDTETGLVFDSLQPNVEICGGTALVMVENDGDVADVLDGGTAFEPLYPDTFVPSDPFAEGPVRDRLENGDLDFDLEADQFNRTVTFQELPTTERTEVEIDIRMPWRQINRIAASMSDGTLIDTPGKQTVINPHVITSGGLADVSLPGVPAGYIIRDVADLDPVVTSDGTNFELTWIRQFRITEPVAPLDGLFGATYSTSAVVTRSYNAAGNPTSPEQYVMRRPTTATNVWHVDVSWTGVDYRATWKQCASGQCDIMTQLVGAAVSTALVTGQAPSVEFDIAELPGDTGAIVVYANGAGAVFGQLVNGSAPDGPAVSLFAAGHSQPHVAFNPITANWLVSARSTAGDVVVDAFALDLAERQDTAQFSSGANTVTDSAIACPAVSAFPVIDLRFEELPGAPLFVDASGNGNDANATPGANLGIGIKGAPEASASSFGLRFNGTSDAVTMANPVAGNVTLAFWYNATTADGQAFNIGTGDIGYGITISDDTIAWQSSGTAASGPSSINDGEWHFVAATRDARSGALAVLVDGVEVASAATSPAPTPAATLSLNGGSNTVTLDQFQVYPRALGADRINQIIERVQAKCVVSTAMTTASGGQFQSADIRFAEPTTRPTIDQSTSLNITVDSDAPTSAVGALDAPTTSLRIKLPEGGTVVLSGHAVDGASGSGIARVEVSVNGGAWIEATGLESWTFPLDVSQGTVSVRTRATDMVGYVEAPGAPTTVSVDGIAPVVTLDAPGAGQSIVPTVNAAGQPQVTLTGSVTDVGTGVPDDGVDVQLRSDDSTRTDDGWQTAAVAGGSWTISYTFPAGVDVSGEYSVAVRAIDVAGNQSADDAATGAVGIDAIAPDASLRSSDAQRVSIGETITIGGSVTDAPGGGVASVDVAFVPIQTVLQLPDGVGVDDASVPHEWQPAVLAESGPGVTDTTWTFQIATNIEDHYQVDLRTTDSSGNQVVVPNVWRGIIDTRAPRVSLVATPTGNTHRNGRRVEVTYRCQAEDLHLREADFDCPGRTLEPTVRRFNVDPILETIFPDQTVLTQLESDFTTWDRRNASPASVTACDVFGNCSTQEAPLADVLVKAVEPESPVQADALIDDLPNAVVVSPTIGQHVAATESIDVMVAAEAPATIKTITLELDGVQVGERSFDLDATTSHEEVLTVPVTAEGTHSLVVQVEDWAGIVDVSTPVDFFLDTAPPALTLESTQVSLADAWAIGSDAFRFRGSVADAGTVATVQIKVDGAAWEDVFFDATSWHTAVRIPGADGSTVPISLRAFDLAGRVTEIAVSTAVDLTPVDTYVRADTQILTEPDASTSATFEFGATSGTNPAVAYGCQLDGRPVVPCTETWTVEDLAGGSHTLRVAAVDTDGLGDLTPAVYTWTIAASGPQPTVTARPADPSPNGNAEFVFTAASGATFECSLDVAAFTSCTSPYQLDGLDLGEHEFSIRVTVGGQTGSAWSHRWTVENASPTVLDQSVFATTNDVAGRTIQLEATDADPLVFRVVDPPQHGFLEGTAPDLTYVPFPDYLGLDSFTFVADDGQSASVPATVDVTVGTATNPTVEVTAAAGQQDPTNVNPVVFDVVFDQQVTTFDDADVRVSGTADTSSHAVSVTPTSSAAVYTVSISGVAGFGTLEVSLDAGAAANSAAQPSAASNTATVMFDAVGPITIVDDPEVLLADDLSTNVSFSVTFDELVTGFDVDDVTVGGTSGATAVTVTGSGAAYIVVVSGVRRAGTVSIDVIGGAVTDALGNPSTTIVRNGTATVANPVLPATGNGSLPLREALLLILAGLVLLLIARRRRSVRWPKRAPQLEAS